MGSVNTFPILIDWKQKVDLSQFTNLDKQVEKFGMRMRLSSRDALRMGSTLDKAATTGMGLYSGLLKGSMDWEAVNEDISLAWGDIGKVIGDTVAPLIEGIVPILEGIADFLEANPWAVWVALLPLVVAFLMKIAAEFFKIYGTGNMFVGMLLTSKGSLLSLKETVEYISVYMTRGEEAAKAYLVSLQKIQGLKMKEQNKDKKGRYAKGFKNVDAKKLKDVEKYSNKGTSALKKLGNAAGLVAGAIGGLSLANIILADSSGAIAEGMQYLTDMFEGLTDWIGGVIGLFMDFADANPEVAKALVVLGGGFLALVTWGPKVAEFFSSAREGIKNFMKEGGLFSKISSSLSKGWDSIAKGVSGALDKVGDFFGNIAGAGLKSVQGMTGSLGKMALAAGSIAIGFTAGFFAAQKLKEMFGNLGPVIIIAIGAFMALAGAIAAAHVAASGPWAPVTGAIILGGIAAVIGGVASMTGLLDQNIPTAAKGGLIKSAGLVRLHPDEIVLPKDSYNMESGPSSLIQPIKKEEEVPTSITININAPIGSKEIADYVTESITRSIESKLKRTR